MSKKEPEIKGLSGIGKPIDVSKINPESVKGFEGVKTWEGSIVKIDQKLADRAHMAFIEILERRAQLAKNYLEIGRLLKEVRDDKLYEYLDYETFKSFLGSIAFRETTAYSHIHIYELYVEKLKIPPTFLIQIPYRMLQKINPVVEQNPEEWLFKAKELSESDLITEVRIAQNKPVRELPPPSKPDKPEPFDYDDYEEFIKAYKCVLCSKEADGAHFPKTKKSGAPDHWKIPLCRGCHSLYHQDPIDFLVTYRNQIFEFFYNVQLSCYKLLKGGKK